MESIYHIVAIRVNETSWVHAWRLHFRYLGTGYDRTRIGVQKTQELTPGSEVYELIDSSVDEKI
jgi:hypothetical protein